MTKPTLANLTLGERLFLARRRLTLTQRDVARRLRLPRRTVQELEGDCYDGAVSAHVRRFTDLGAAVSDSERCVIARRRRGQSVSDVAAELGVSRQWVNELESGRETVIAPLLDHWGLLGKVRTNATF